MVKTTAQTLQAFGTELAETELPNDAEATTNLLHTHTLKKDTMKVRDAFVSYTRHPTICLSVCLLRPLLELPVPTVAFKALVFREVIWLIFRKTCRWRCLKGDACWIVSMSLYRQTLNIA